MTATTESTVSIESSPGGSIWLACGDRRLMLDGGDGTHGQLVGLDDDDMATVAAESYMWWRVIERHCCGLTETQANQWLIEHLDGHSSSDWYCEDA